MWTISLMGSTPFRWILFFSLLCPFIKASNFILTFYLLKQHSLPKYFLYSNPLCYLCLDFQYPCATAPSFFSFCRWNHSFSHKWPQKQLAFSWFSLVYVEFWTDSTYHMTPRLLSVESSASFFKNVSTIF